MILWLQERSIFLIKNSSEPSIYCLNASAVSLFLSFLVSSERCMKFWRSCRQRGSIPGRRNTDRFLLWVSVDPFSQLEKYSEIFSVQLKLKHYWQKNPEHRIRFIIKSNLGKTNQRNCFNQLQWRNVASRWRESINFRIKTNIRFK